VSRQSGLRPSAARRASSRVGCSNENPLAVRRSGTTFWLARMVCVTSSSP